MLTELEINNLAVIKEGQLNFTSDYVALVGETGAGKSLIIDALGLLNGNKADFSLIRDKKKKTSISACFTIDEKFAQNHPGITDYIDDNQIVLKRVLTPEHSNRYYLNGELCTLNEYKKAIDHLIDIHSQGANSDLLNENKQLFYLDSYGGEKLKKVKGVFDSAFAQLTELKRDLNTLINDNKELDRDYLEFQIKEIEKYKLQPDEIENLNAEYESLKQYEDIRNKYENYSNATSFEEGQITDILYRIKNSLSPFASTSLKEEAAELLVSLNETIERLIEFDDTFKNLDANPERIDEINERLFELKGLQRKYGRSTKEILSKLEEYKEKLSNIEQFETKKFNLENKIKKASDEALKAAEKLSGVRKEIALKLTDNINAELSDLGLLSDGFSIHFSLNDLSASGIDKVSFYVSLNKGLEASPLAKAASGGEASRLMLALKVVLDKLDPYDVLVFDEVDTGVSGKIAALVSKKLYTLSTTSQIIVISHLPQVVASCKTAFKVAKANSGDETMTSITSISEEELIDEIAKLISGKEVTEAAREQAKALRHEYSNG